MEIYVHEFDIKSKRKTALALILTALLILSVRLFNIDKAVSTLIILAYVCILFITELVPLIYTAACVPIILYLSGCATTAQAFSGFSNDSVILFVGMFIVGGAIFRTGAATGIGNIVLAKAGNNIKRLVISILVLTAVFSSVMSNTGCVAVFMPVCIGIADAAAMDRKKLLIPLAMMSSLGGTMTMVGTPPNITVNSIYEESGLGSFSFFEYAWVGLPLTIIGGLFLFLVYGKNNHIKGKDSYEIHTYPLSRRQIMSLVILAAVVLVMATNLISLSMAAVIAAVTCLAGGLCSGKDALEDIDWKTVLLFAGMLPMSSALERTGAGKLIADASVKLMGGHPSEFVAITVLFVIAGGLTQVMSNTASCALLAPIGLQIAEALGANPGGVLMAIGIASSCAFMTPMATPPNTLVFGAANAKFSDYLKIGTPLLIIGYLICILIIPRTWPFF